MAGKRICSVWLILALLCTGAFPEPALAGQQEAGQDREGMAEGSQGFAPSDSETGREQQGQAGNYSVVCSGGFDVTIEYRKNEKEIAA